MTEAAKNQERPGEGESKANVLRQLAQGGSHAFLMRIGGMILLFALQVVLTRILGLRGYGEFAYVLSWVNILAFVATAGMDRVALRFVAQYRILGEHSLLRGFLRRCYELSAAGALVCIVFVLGFTLLLHDRLSHSQFSSLMVGSLIIPILAQSTISDCTLMALGSVVQGLLSNVLRPALVIVLMLTAAQLPQFAHSSTNALVIYLLACGVCWAVAAGFVRKWLREKSIGPARDYRTRLWVSAAIPLMLVILLNFLQNQSGVILAGLFLGPSQAGLFSAASRISEAVLLGFNSINTVIAPTYAALHATNDYSPLKRTARLSAWGSTAFTAAALVPLLIFGRPIMHLFGPEFVAAYPLLLVLLLNPIIMSVCGSVNILLNMTGHQNICLRIFAITTAVYLLLCVFMVPLWGIMGIAVSNVLTTAMWNIMLLYYVKRELGMWSCIGKP